MTEIDPDDPFQGFETDRTWCDDQPTLTALLVVLWTLTIVWTVFQLGIYLGRR